jgi:phosphonate transport system substrate-binding protein
MLYCNGTDKLATPSGLDAITKIAGAKVAVLGPGSPAGYIYPMLALKEKGIDIDNGFQKILSPPTTPR